MSEIKQAYIMRLLAVAYYLHIDPEAKARASDIIPERESDNNTYERVESSEL